MNWKPVDKEMVIKTVIDHCERKPTKQELKEIETMTDLALDFIADTRKHIDKDLASKKIQMTDVEEIIVENGSAYVSVIQQKLLVAMAFSMHAVIDKCKTCDTATCRMSPVFNEKELLMIKKEAIKMKRGRASLENIVNEALDARFGKMPKTDPIRSE